MGEDVGYKVNRTGQDDVTGLGKRVYAGPLLSLALSGFKRATSSDSLSIVP